MNIFENCIKRQEKIDSIVNTLGIEEIAFKNAIVKDRIMNPSHYVVMLGETSAGKSTLINSVLRKKVLAESVKPTTGVVTEVVISNDDDNGDESLLKIKKNGNTQIVAKENFDKFTINPSDDIARLRYVGQGKDSKYSGIRIFDTPGYGSLVDYHEDVLKDFIPEADFIVYVVSYKTGLNDDDYQFLKFVGEVISDRIEVVLAVNMCPMDIQPENKRVLEIKKNVDECIHRDIRTFCVETSMEKNPDTHVLWDYIYERVNNPKAKEDLGKTLKNYQDYILSDCEIKVNSRIANIESEKNDMSERKKLIKEFLQRKDEIAVILERGFTKTVVKSVKLIDKSALSIKENVTNYINDEAKWTKREETFSLMQHYYVPKLTSEETENILAFIEDEVIMLDNQIEEMLNNTVAVLEHKVKVNIPVYAEVMEGILKKHIGDAIKQAAGEMFRNVDTGSKDSTSLESTSKNLKNLDNSPSIEGNNGLVRLIKAIRASSLKGITKYLSVFTDSFMYLYDALTWQSKINEISMEAIDNWAGDVEVAIRKYLEELKQRNRDEIIALFDELAEEFKEDTENELEDSDLDYESLLNLKREIDFTLHKCLFGLI